MNNINIKITSVKPGAIVSLARENCVGKVLAIVQSNERSTAVVELLDSHKVRTCSKDALRLEAANCGKVYVTPDGSEVTYDEILERACL